MEIIDNKTDFDDKQNEKNIFSLSEEQIKKILNDDNFALDDENQNVEQRVKILTQEKIKNLIEKYGELFHFAEDSKAVIEDYDEYFARLKEFELQVDDLETALKKYPKLAALLAILITLQARIISAQKLAQAKQANEQNKHRAQVARNEKQTSKIFEGALKQKINKDRNIAISKIAYGNKSPKASEFFDVAKIGKNGEILVSSTVNGNIKIKPQDANKANKNKLRLQNLKPKKIKLEEIDQKLKEDEKKLIKPDKPEKKKQNKKTPKIERVFDGTNQQNKPTQPKLSESQIQQNLQSYNRNVAQRAERNQNPPQMSRGGSQMSK